MAKAQRWLKGQGKCDHCGHEAEVMWRVGVKRLQCPRCGRHGIWPPVSGERCDPPVRVPVDGEVLDLNDTDKAFLKTNGIDPEDDLRDDYKHRETLPVLERRKTQGGKRRASS